MLSLTFKLQPLHDKSFAMLCVSGRLLGDVFNGWFKRWLIDTNSRLSSALRPPQNERALYALRVMPITLEPEVSGLAVNITLFGEVTSQANCLLERLLNVDQIELGPPKCLFVPFQFMVALPGQTPASLLDIETGLYESIPEPWLSRAQTTVLTQVGYTSDVQLKLLTPPRLGQLESNELPSLLQVARSLAKKLLSVEPCTAQELGLETKEWFDQERELKNCHLVDHSTEPRSWTYHSENQKAHLRSSWIGTLHYQGPISEKVMQLLWLGQWLGLGQNASGGQGHYTLQKN